MKTFNLKQTAAPNLGQLISDLKGIIAFEEVLEKLGLGQTMHRVGDELQGDCPTGHSSVSHRSFTVNTKEGFYHCFNCKIGGDLVDLVALMRNVDIFNASRWLAEQFAPSMVEQFDSLVQNMTEEEREYHDRALLYRLALDRGKEQLFDPIGLDSLQYLVNDRKYDRGNLEKTDWMYWDTDQNIRAFLLAKKPGMVDQIQTLPLQGAFGDRFRLALPYFDRHGRIVGFLKRAHEPLGFNVNGKQVRWDSTKGLKKRDLFGLHRIRKADELVIVEGYPDAAYLHTLGINNVVALGTATFSESYLEGLRAKNIKRVILALDNDGGTGMRNTEETVRRLSETEFRTFVIDPTLLGQYKDPDEFVMANGADAFTLLIKNAALGTPWLAKRILMNHPITTSLGREKAISECLELADSVDHPREAEEIIQTLSGTLNLTDEVLVEEYRMLQERQAAERLRQGIGKVAGKVGHLITEGDPEEALRVLQDQSSELQNDYLKAKEPVRESLTDFLIDKKQKDSIRTLGQRIGYQLTDFAAIDEVINGLQSGLYIIAADPNIGKTAFMVSLMIDVLKSNPDVSCLFYSMDDSRDTIINRMLAHLTDLRINEVRFKQDDPAFEKILDDGYRYLSHWAQQGRLEIKEASSYLTMSRIQGEIQLHPNRSNLVVFIDGLYNVPVDESHNSIREENIDRATQVKQLVKLFKIPVIATAEFRKHGREESKLQKKERSIHDIMETGKYGYNADLAILLSPKFPDQYRDQDEPIIIADFGKNKLESFKGWMEFKFIRAKSVMQYVKNSITNP